MYTVANKCFPLLCSQVRNPTTAVGKAVAGSSPGQTS